MTSKSAFGLALLVLASSIWVYLGGPAGSQETSQEALPGKWEAASNLAEDCDRQAPECVGLLSHAAVALDRFDCRSGLPSDGYPCGKVLLAGGAALSPDGNLIFEEGLAKIYDPVSNTWVASIMKKLRGSQGKSPAAVLLDGPECRAAASTSQYPCGHVLVVGEDNRNDLGKAATSEVYDPVLKKWDDQKTLPGLFYDPVAVLLDGPGCADKCGMVLVTGSKTGVAALYDPRSDEWTPISGPIIARDLTPPTFTVLSSPGCADKCGNVLLAGGDVGAGKPVDPVRATELYDPAQEIWVPTEEMQEPRSRHSAALLNGFQCEAPSPPDWCGNVLVAGGKTEETDSQYDSAERYRPRRGDWILATTATDKMSARRQSPSITPLPDGRALIVGGTGDQPQDAEAAQVSGDVYNPSNGEWSEAPDKATYRFNHSATRLPDGPLSGCGVKCGAVLVAGGSGDDGSTSDPHDDIVTAELFYPAPAISEVIPPACGGAEVVITGAGFASATEVRFDGEPAASFRVDPQRPDSKITAVSPHGAVGSQSVTVAATGGSTKPEQFSYVSPPAISSLTPDRGPVVGGTPVTITGTGLGQVSEVKFGSQPASSFQVLSDTQISAVSPSHLRAETVDLSVTVAGCTSQRPFTYFTLPLANLDPVDPIPAGGGAAQNTTIVNPGALPSAPGSQQSIGGTTPPAPPTLGTAPAVLSVPAPAPVPGPVAGQAAAPTLVSGASMVPSVEAAAPGAGLAIARVAPQEEPAVRHGMVRTDPVSSAPAALAISSVALGSLMLIGCCASGGRKYEPRPGPQGAY